MSTVILEDEEGVIKGAHYYLFKRCSLERLEREILKLLEERGSLPLSAIWRRFDCHLWEVCAALRRLKRRGLLEESDAALKDYRNP